MASSEVSEVLTSFEDDPDLMGHSGSLGGLDDPTRTLMYGEDLIAVSSEDVPQSEEIIAGSDPLSPYETIPVPESPRSLSPLPVQTSGNELEGVTRKPTSNQSSSRPPRGRRKPDPFVDETPSNPDVVKRHVNGGSWQQKRVSIKTLEGEFSVTMWASGTDEGTNSFILQFPKLLLFARIITLKV